MSTIRTKLEYLLETRRIFRAALIDRGMEIGEDDSFRSYAEKFRDAPYLKGSYVRCYLDKTAPVPASGGTRTMYILTDGSHWTIHAPEWLGVSQTEGDKDAEVVLTFPEGYDREEYETVKVSVENGLKESSCEVMLYNYPLMFYTDGLAAEEYKVNGQTFTTEVDNEGPYVYRFGIDEVTTSIDLSKVQGLTEVASTPWWPGWWHSSLGWRFPKLKRWHCGKRCAFQRSDCMLTNLSALEEAWINGESFDALTTTGLGSGNSGAFQGCSALKTLHGTEEWDTKAVTSMQQMFRGCAALQSLNVGGWDTKAVTNMNGMFYGCAALQDITGEWRNINTALSLANSPLSRESALVIINGLADRTGQTALTLSLSSYTKGLLTVADKAQIVAKNWTLA